MAVSETVLQKVTSPVHRKGDTEEHIYARNQKARTTAALVAGVNKAKELKGIRA
ncbi:hypothetical protein [Devosia epidermidihirudinis]|uniref:hypothetical protein n=1 Tax=Devosia epidermidihirudinis TaxID=1293439 RepID=UPI000A802D41|nr:hypothetical protein [Devosia epidermidihirudinis]